MKNILLVCSAGMSTSMLVKKMQDASDAQGLETTIWAVSATAAQNEWQKADVVMLGPQVRFMEKDINEMVNNSLPVQVIDMAAYGTMNGAKVLETALSLIK